MSYTRTINIEAFLHTEDNHNDRSEWPEWLTAALGRNPVEIGALNQPSTEAGNGPFEITTPAGPVVWPVGFYVYVLPGLSDQLFIEEAAVFEELAQPV